MWFVIRLCVKFVCLWSRIIKRNIFSRRFHHFPLNFQWGERAFAGMGGVVPAQLKDKQQCVVLLVR